MSSNDRLAFLSGPTAFYTRSRQRIAARAQKIQRCRSNVAIQRQHAAKEALADPTQSAHTNAALFAAASIHRVAIGIQLVVAAVRMALREEVAL